MPQPIPTVETSVSGLLGGATVGNGEGPHVNDTNSGTIELSEGEAQTVVSALADYQTRVSGTDEEDVLALKNRIAEEFGLGSGTDGDDAGMR